MSYLDDEYDEDCETEVMSGGVEELKKNVVGHRIVSVTREEVPDAGYGQSNRTRFVLDDGTSVLLYDTDDCCAFTEVESFKFLEGVDNVITSVETDTGFEKWFIYADRVPVVEMDVSWSPGNPYYYGFGFQVTVEKENN